MEERPEAREKDEFLSELVAMEPRLGLARGGLGELEAVIQETPGTRIMMPRRGTQGQDIGREPLDSFAHDPRELLCRQMVQETLNLGRLRPE
jgi:hypothetical protein